MNGPFYKKTEKGKYKLAPCCKECAFCDEEDNFCCQPTCLYFDGIEFEVEIEIEEDKDNGNSK